MKSMCVSPSFNHHETKQEQWASNISHYYINTSEIPSELSHENLISSHVKIPPLLWLHNKLHLYRPRNFLSKMVWHFIGVYIINRMLHGRLEIRNFSSCVEKNISLVHCAHSWNIFQQLKRNFVFLHGHVISSISTIFDETKQAQQMVIGMLGYCWGMMKFRAK